MKYIVKINEPFDKYIYSVWSVAEYEDGTISQDTRIFFSDDKTSFLAFMASFILE